MNTEAKNKNPNQLYALFVDDAKDLLLLASQSVKMLGFTALTANNGFEALELLEKHQKQIMIVVSDFDMPGMTGFELRAKINAKWKNLPFIILSGYLPREDALAAIDLKISGFLEKPFNLKALAELIKKESIDRVTAFKEEKELLDGFVNEALGNIESLEPLIFELETRPDDPELINRIFGLVHTLKGASGFFDPPTLHHFVHKFEDFLSRIKKGEIKAEGAIISTILESISLLSALVDELSSGNHTPRDFEKLIAPFKADLTSATQGGGAATNATAAGGANQAQSAAKKDLRVSMELLDEFMHTSGEMTVIRNMIEKLVGSLEKLLPGNSDIARLTGLVQQSHKINGSIQTKITELRQIPIKSILRSYPRLIRELAGKLNKEVEFVTEGDDLRVDTSVADVLSQVLVHMVRNSLDHGFETTAERAGVAKPPRGTLKINTFSKGDDIIVKISDDGRGIDVNKIKEKLIKNGMPLSQIEGMAEAQILMQIFEPGFSTAVVITDVSGRGVGMDVVKKSIESLKGEVSITTKVGQGTEFTLRVPAPRSVQISNSLVVRIGKSRFCIPQDDIVKVLDIQRDDESNTQGKLEGAKVLRIFSDTVPVVDLHHLLGITAPTQNAESVLKTIVLRTESGISFAVNVDEILDIEDAFIKPLPPLLKTIPIYSGATFLADGQISLMLSPQGIADKAQLTALQKKISPQAHLGSAQNIGLKKEIILFDLEGVKGTFAIPCDIVSRIENCQFKDLQKTGSHWVMPYRGKILNFLNLSATFKGPTHSKLDLPPDQNLISLVVNIDQKMTAIVVKSIIEIREDIYGEDMPLTFEGLRSLPFPDRVVNLVDVKTLLAS